MKTIIIIGAGAAGFFSAIHHAYLFSGAKIILIEKSREVLSKVRVSGGGRCNVTHACFDPKTLAQHYPRGAKELIGPFHRFQPQDTMNWFESKGVPLKTESDNRVFPKSDSSQSIIDCLVKEARSLGVSVWTGCTVSDIQKTNFGFSLSLKDRQTIDCEKLILATGSSRQGYQFAKQLGHTIIDPVPSLFTFKIPDSKLHSLSGLSVPHVRVYLDLSPQMLQEGPILVTHWGFSGPAIIKLSAWQAKVLHQADYKAYLSVCWCPEYTPEYLISYLRDYGSIHLNRHLSSHSPFETIPKRLWAYLVGRISRISTTWGALNETEMNRLVAHLLRDTYSVIGKGVFKDEFVTCGGVELSEINFKTMESKCCPGLHLVGELLNIDGITGGFKFQNAWTTGFLSGQG